MIYRVEDCGRARASISLTFGAEPRYRQGWRTRYHLIYLSPSAPSGVACQVDLATSDDYISAISRIVDRARYDVQAAMLPAVAAPSRSDALPMAAWHAAKPHLCAAPDTALFTFQLTLIRKIFLSTLALTRPGDAVSKFYLSRNRSGLGFMAFSHATQKL